MADSTAWPWLRSYVLGQVCTPHHTLDKRHTAANDNHGNGSPQSTSLPLYKTAFTHQVTVAISSTCVVLALVAGRQDCRPRPNSQRQPLRLFLNSFRLQHFYMTVNIASQMHSNAFQCIAQPNTTFA